MSKWEKLLAHIMMGYSDSNVLFSDLCRLLHKLGFECRIRGDHYIFSMDGVEEILNLQPKNNRTKSYQVRQVRNLLLKYKLKLED